MTALVIGNGESRNGIDVSTFSCVKIGCNAIHRDFAVDHLVCVDRRTLQEAVQSNAPSIYTRQEWLTFTKDPRVKLVPQLPYTGELREDDPWNWGSGQFAILIGASLSDHIHIIGFDLWGNGKLVNNVYKDTANYDPATKRAVDPRYWIYQNFKIFQCYPDKYFTIYNLPNWPIPESWKMANVEFKTLDILSRNI